MIGFPVKCLRAGLCRKSRSSVKKRVEWSSPKEEPGSAAGGHWPLGVAVRRWGDGVVAPGEGANAQQARGRRSRHVCSTLNTWVTWGMRRAVCARY